MVFEWQLMVNDDRFNNTRFWRIDKQRDGYCIRRRDSYGNDVICRLLRKDIEFIYDSLRSFLLLTFNINRGDEVYKVEDNTLKIFINRNEHGFRLVKSSPGVYRDGELYFFDCELAGLITSLKLILEQGA